MASTPRWILQLVDDVMENMVRQSSDGTWLYWELPPDAENPDWHLDIFPTPYEIEGGREDGARKVSGFELDLGALCTKFSPAPSILWVVGDRGPDDHDSPAIEIFGRYRGRQITLQIYSEPCTDAQPTVIVNAFTGRSRHRDVRDATNDAGS